MALKTTKASFLFRKISTAQLGIKHEWMEGKRKSNTPQKRSLGPEISFIWIAKSINVLRVPSKKIWWRKSFNFFFYLGYSNRTSWCFIEDRRFSVIKLLRSNVLWFVRNFLRSEYFSLSKNFTIHLFDFVIIVLYIKTFFNFMICPWPFFQLIFFSKNLSLFSKHVMIFNSSHKNKFINFSLRLFNFSKDFFLQKKLKNFWRRFFAIIHFMKKLKNCWDELELLFKIHSISSSHSVKRKSEKNFPYFSHLVFQLNQNNFLLK